METIYLDGGRLARREEAHDYLSTVLSLPDYYGRNLDALFDCLTDLTEDTTIRLFHRDLLEFRLGRRGKALIRLLRRAARENPHLTLLEE